MKKMIKTVLNGKEIELDIEPGLLVLDVLRDVLKRTGTKEGCGTGDCGACTILWNGKAVNSCLMLANRMNNAEIWTIEGLSNNDVLHPIQESFIEEGATQCGFCTPGFIIRTKALLDENPNPSEDDIKDGLSGNLCRCTGYVHIINAVQSAAKKMAK
jgi:aerobic-type carbon monoxide dehydrogenase small subunit (CoxS/CutS family)